MTICSNFLRIQVQNNIFKQGKYFDLEIDFQGNLIGAHIMHCKFCFFFKTNIEYCLT